MRGRILELAEEIEQEASRDELKSAIDYETDPRGAMILLASSSSKRRCSERIKELAFEPIPYDSLHWSDEKVAQEADALALSFYAMMGYSNVSPDYKLRNSRHPQERLCWAMACESFERLHGTDPEDAISAIE